MSYFSPHLVQALYWATVGFLSPAMPSKFRVEEEKSVKNPSAVLPPDWRSEVGVVSAAGVEEVEGQKEEVL